MTWKNILAVTRRVRKEFCMPLQRYIFYPEYKFLGFWHSYKWSDGFGATNVKFYDARLAAMFLNPEKRKLACDLDASGPSVYRAFLYKEPHDESGESAGFSVV